MTKISKRISTPVLLLVLSVFMLSSLVLPPTVYGQDDNEKSATEETTTVTVDEEEQAPSDVKNVVTDIDIRGNRIISTNTILSKLKSKKGTSLVQETVNEDIKRLYGHLAAEWVAYAEHLQANYPFLFSLVARTHPFQEHPSPIVT